MVKRGDKAGVSLSSVPGGILGAGAIEVPAAKARLWLAWSAHGLTLAHWADAQLGIAEALGPGHPPEAEVPEPYWGVLQRYFSAQQPGQPVDSVDPTILPVDLRGTPFQLEVWQALRRIPRGQVRSYASIARDVGSVRAMRAVGGANGKNPVAVVVPCHRVVEADMSLGGYSGGLQYKRYLLALEGSQFVGDRVQPGQLDLLGS